MLAGTSGGENAKFGVSTAELVAASELLKSEGLAHTLSDEGQSRQREG